MNRTLFPSHLAGCPPLKSVLDRYAAVLMTQLATSATCLRYHEVGPRLARWLLMNQDWIGPSRLNITQDQLGAILGVRRVSITTAASELQRRGLIEYRRGDLQILDRPGLEAVAWGAMRTIATTTLKPSVERADSTNESLLTLRFAPEIMKTISGHNNDC